MGRTKLLVSYSLLLFTLSEAFLGSGRLSKIHCTPSRSVKPGSHLSDKHKCEPRLSEREAICLQIRERKARTLFQVHVGVYLDFKLYQDLYTLNNSFNACGRNQFKLLLLQLKKRKQAYLTKAMYYDVILN